MEQTPLILLSASCVLCMYSFEYVSCLYDTSLFYLLYGFRALCMIDNSGHTGANMCKASKACLAPSFL